MSTSTFVSVPDIFGTTATRLLAERLPEIASDAVSSPAATVVTGTDGASTLTTFFEASSGSADPLPSQPVRARPEQAMAAATRSGESDLRMVRHSRSSQRGR